MGSAGLAVAWACFATFLVFWFLGELSKAAEAARAEHTKTGDTSLAELSIALSPEAFFVLRLFFGIFLLLIAMAATGRLPIAGVCFAFGFFAPQSYLNRLRRKRVKTAELQLVEGLELMGNSLKSGLTLPQAVELLVKEFPPPLSKEFSLLLAETRLGVDFNDALENMANRLNSTIFHILATGVAVTKRCGGDMTQIFANIATTIREQATIEGKLDSVTAQARFQGLILSIMPFALIVILWFVDRSHVETLFGYTIGVWAIVLVVIMVLMAQAWISKLLAIDV